MAHKRLLYARNVRACLKTVAQSIYICIAAYPCWMIIESVLRVLVYILYGDDANELINNVFLILILVATNMSQPLALVVNQNGPLQLLQNCGAGAWCPGLGSRFSIGSLIPEQLRNFMWLCLQGTENLSGDLRCLLPDGAEVDWWQAKAVLEIIKSRGRRLWPLVTGNLAGLWSHDPPKHCYLVQWVERNSLFLV